jgi:hypothetical protein
MLDVGRMGRPVPLPSVPISSLKSQLENPLEFFLGSDLEAIRLPGDAGEYYALPPSKSHVLESEFDPTSQHEGFAPVFSLARGGFGEAWTGGCYPFNDEDLRDFPMNLSDLQPFYEEVAQRIGISGCDDLDPQIPFHGEIQPPVQLDAHSAGLLEAYRQQSRHLSRDVMLGHARSAVISQAAGERDACSSLGRCLWGCPTSSFYVPSLTLDECLRHPRFEYLPDLRVSHAACDSSRQIRAVVAHDQHGHSREIDVETLVLAAGTLSTSMIYLRSLHHAGETNLALPGLMDNRQVLIPFLTPRMFGQPVESDAYQYHRLAMVVRDAGLSVDCHGQLTTLKEVLGHPIFQRLPLALPTAIKVFQSVRSGMGLLNLSFPDTRRPGNRISLVCSDGNPHVAIDYRPAADERQIHRRVKRRVREFLRHLGCWTHPFWEFTRPTGASIHYAGTLPMSATPEPRTVSSGGRSHDFPNLWIADASAFPFLPAKSLTLTIMANAIRTAHQILRSHPKS